MAAGLTGFHEEIDAASRPRHATGAVGEMTGAGQVLFQRGKQEIKPLEVVKARHCGSVGERSRALLSFGETAKGGTAYGDVTHWEGPNGRVDDAM